MADGNVKGGSVFWDLVIKTEDAKTKVDSLGKSVGNLNKLFGLFKVFGYITFIFIIITYFNK